MLLTLLPMVGVLSAVHAIYHLPLDLLPRHYLLEIETSFDENMNDGTFRGRVHIQVECVNSTRIIQVHKKNLDIEEINETDRGVVVRRFRDKARLTVTSSSYDKETEVLTIVCDSEMEKGEMYTAIVHYKGSLSNHGEGMLRKSFKDDDGVTKWYAETDLQTGARAVFPCLDEPSLRASFTIHVTRHVTMRAITNAPITRTSATDDALLMTDEFERTSLICPHQVTIMIAGLASRVPRLPASFPPLRLWGRPRILDQLEVAVTDPGRVASLFPRFLSFFRDYFSSEPPIRETVLLALPGLAVGYRPHMNLIVTSEEMLLSGDLSLREVNRVAHDSASQWTGGLVSFCWWSDLWYTFGLSEYLATLAIQQVLPNLSYPGRILVSRLESVFKHDSVEADGDTLYQQIDYPEEIFDKYYTTIFFDKGPLLMRMLHLTLGDEVFRQGLRRFLQKFCGGCASSGDLWEVLTETARSTRQEPPWPAGVTVEDLLQPWLTQAGYPSLTVTRRYDTGEATISQRPYTKDKREVDDASRLCWELPLTYSSAQNFQFNNTLPQSWLTCPPTGMTVQTVAKPSDWIIFNNQFAGLYRVTYDNDNWSMLSTALQAPGFSGIPVLNRVQLVADVLDHGAAGRVEYDAVFSVLGYLRRENKYLPWKVALPRLTALRENLLRTPKYRLFKKFMRKQLGNIFERFQDLRETADEEDRLFKRFIVKWACENDVPLCRQRARALFLKWKASQPQNHVLIPKDVRREVFCKGIEEGNEADWNFLQKYYEQSKDVDERKHILFGLSCTNNVQTLNRYLEWSLVTESEQLLEDVFRKVVAREEGFPVALAFLSSNLRRIIASTRSEDELVVLVDLLTARVVTRQELTEVKNIVKSNKDLFSESEEDLESSFKAAKEKVTWLDKNYNRITVALEQVDVM